jgi:hypothetical protein
MDHFQIQPLRCANPALKPGRHQIAHRGATARGGTCLPVSIAAPAEARAVDEVKDIRDQAMAMRLAVAKPEIVKAGGRTLSMLRLTITDIGRQALAGKATPAAA